MAESTLTYLDDHSTDWNTNTVIQQKRDALETKLDEINDIELIQNTDITGNVTAKEGFKKKMAEKGLVISKAMQVFARDTNNAVLLAEIDFQLSDLLHVKDSDAKDRCQLVHDRAFTNTAALASYGVTALMITDLKNAIKDFNDSLGKPAAAKGVTTAATTDLETAFTELDGILLDLDTMIDTLRFSKKTFWEGYRAVRKRVDTGVRHQSARFVLVDKITKAKIGQGVVSFPELNLIKKVSKRSVVTFFDSETGIGSFNVSATANLYKAATVSNFVLQDGVVARLVIELEKE